MNFEKETKEFLDHARDYLETILYVKENKEELSNYPEHREQRAVNFSKLSATLHELSELIH